MDSPQQAKNQNIASNLYPPMCPLLPFPCLPTRTGVLFPLKFCIYYVTALK